MSENNRVTEVTSSKRKLIILCVDGLDPDYAGELGFPKMQYESKLSIPKELFYEGVPHTQLIWPSMLSGKIVLTDFDFSLRLDIWLGGIRLPIRRLLHKHRIEWKREKRGTWGINPANLDIETVGDRYNTIMWNFPTMCPEFICKFPSLNDMLRYGRREYEVWKMVTYGMCLYPYDLSVAYCHLPDILGHMKKPLEDTYLDVYHHAMMLSKYRTVMLVSDHGCLDGEHTHHAYLGCMEPVEAKSVLEVRADIERILTPSRYEGLESFIPSILMSDIQDLKAPLSP